MKTKEQELVLLGLQEINESEKDEFAGGCWCWYPPKDITFKDILVCCMNIPPADIFITER